MDVKTILTEKGYEEFVLELDILYSLLYQNRVPIIKGINTYYIIISDDVHLPLGTDKELKVFIRRLHNKNKKVILSIRGDKSFWKRFVLRDKVRDREITKFVKNLDEFMEYNNFDGIEFYWKGLTIFNYKKWKYFIKFLNDHFSFSKRKVYSESPFCKLFKKLL